MTRIMYKMLISGTVAHLHHFMDHIRSGRPVKDAVLIVGFQLLYTTLFGAYATFLFMRTGGCPLAS